MNTNSLLIYYLLGINIVAFALYGIDKLKSKKRMVAHTGKDIAHACHIEPASLTSILNRMEKQHMIERKNLNGNRRSFHIFLTDYGMELSESIEKAFLSLKQEVFSGISNAEKEQFLKIFEKLYKNTTKEE